jgi:protoporphyrinogen oxidase/peptidoglycan/xylan/chitin deacetylase (PgdA/CDA1 family)
MLGLTLAHRLAQDGQEVTVLEAAPEIGGLASAWQVGDVTWDRHYHVTLLSDSALRHVLDELGLDDQIRWVTTKTGFYADGRLSPMSDAIEYLKLPALTMVDKARLGSTILWGSRVRDWKKLEQTPVQTWLTRVSGERVFDRVWRPLLLAKLGESYHDASAAFIWATIQRLYAARRSGLKEERFGYVPGGYAHVLERFADALRAEGVDLQTSCPVSKIDRDLTVHTTDGRALAFDRVVVTANPPVAVRLCPTLTEAERRRLEAVRYQGVICASLVLRTALAPYYLTYITDPGIPFTAVVEMTAFVDTDQTARHHLVYLPLYVDPSDPRFELSDDDLRASFWPGLKKMYPHLGDEDLLTFQVSRVRNVFPIPTLGYSDAVPPIDTSIPGLHLVSSANIVNGTLNVNETVTLAEDAALHLLGRAAAHDDRPIASLSLDLDNQWSYMKTHGDAGWEELPSYLDVVVPRVLSLLEERDLRITFFVVGTDADRAENERAIESLARAGHEIGNHSYRHEPWLHLYDSGELEEELRKAEAAIERVTGQRPIGFRGPGYSLSEDTLRTLVGRGYRYDASTLPTVVGPLARAFYFRTAKLDAEQRRERSGLFGQFKDGLRPLRPYRWSVGEKTITELPVTTMPLARVPIHVSYLVYFARVSPALARMYFRFALALCKRRRVEVSILLHPLDFLGADDVGALGFFPGMEMPTDRKIAVATDAIDELARQFRVVPLVEHVAAIEHRGGLPSVPATRANPSRPA